MITALIAVSDDCPWLAHYPDRVPKSLSLPLIPAWGLLERTAHRHPNRLACRYYHQTLTYAEMAEQARRMASMLVRFGLQPGERVGILFPNLPEYVWVLNGIWMAGGVAVALSPLMVAEEVDAFLKTTGCRFAVCLDVLAPLIVPAPHKPEHLFFATINDRLPTWQKIGYAFARWRRLGKWPTADHPSHHSLPDQVAASDPHFEPRTPASLEDPAYILPTGGTTGNPKAVTLSHRNLVANAWQIFHWAGGVEARERMLCVLPFFHSYGLTTCCMSGVAMASTLIMHHRFIPRVVVKLIQQYQPTIFPAVPAMLAALNDLLRPLDSLHTKEPGTPTSSGRIADQLPIPLRYVISGGAPLDRAIADEFTRYSGAIVVEGYGMSEASPVITTGPLDGSDRPGTIGLPLPGTEVRIVDPEDDSRELPLGDIGELVVRGPQVMLGYWQDAAATEVALKHGWLHTGDLGTRDSDGFFRIVDRKKDLIITSGFNVYPADVEPVLRQAPGVADVAVIGLPDATAGEVVKAIIAIKPGTSFNRAAFDAYADQHLAKHKRPKVVEVVEGDLPRNFLGKVLRRKLKT